MAGEEGKVSDLNSTPRADAIDGARSQSSRLPGSHCTLLHPVQAQQTPPPSRAARSAARRREVKSCVTRTPGSATAPSRPDPARSSACAALLPPRLAPRDRPAHVRAARAPPRAVVGEVGRSPSDAVDGSRERRGEAERREGDSHSVGGHGRVVGEVGEGGGESGLSRNGE